MRRLDSITDSMDMNLSKLQEIVEHRGAWRHRESDMTATEHTDNPLNIVPCYRAGPCLFLQLSGLGLVLSAVIVVQLLSGAGLFVTQWTAASQFPVLHHLLEFAQIAICGFVHQDPRISSAGGTNILANNPELLLCFCTSPPRILCWHLLPPRRIPPGQAPTCGGSQTFSATRSTALKGHLG